METWQNLVPVLSRFINGNELNIKTLFKTIKETVSVDCGILSPIPGGEDQLFGLNSWLMYNIIKVVAAKPDSEEIHIVACELQTKILMECKTKQILTDLLENVVVFMEQIAECFETNSFGKTIWFIDTRSRHIPEFMDIQFSNMSFEIQRNKSLTAVMLLEIKVLNQTLNLIVNNNQKLMIQISRMVNKLMIHAPMVVKFEVLRYFTMSYKKRIQFKSEEHLHMIENLRYWTNLLGFKGFWIGNEEKYDYDELVFELKSYFHCVVLAIDKNENMNQKVAGFFLNILKNFGEILSAEKIMIWPMQKISRLVVRQMIRLDVKNDSLYTDWLAELLKYIEVMPEILTLLQKPIVSEIANKQEILLPTFIKKVKELAEKTQDTNFNTLDSFYTKMTVWQSICILISNVHEILHSNAQQKALKENSNLLVVSSIEIPIIPTFQSLKLILKNAVSVILKKLEETSLQLQIDFIAVTMLDFAFHAFNLFQILKVSENLMIKLIYLILSPLCKGIEELSSNLPKNVVQFYQHLPNDIRYNALILRGLKLMFSTSLKNLQDKFIDLLKLCVDHVISTHNDRFIDVCVNLLTNILVTTDLDINWLNEKILEPAFNSKRHLILATILIDLITLSCTDSFILRTVLNPVARESFEYKPFLLNNPDTIECSSYKIGNVSSIKNLIETMKNKCGIIMQNPIAAAQKLFLNEIILKIMKFFGDQELEVKLIMLKSLPSIIQHTNYGMQEPYLELWLSYFKTTEPNLMHVVSITTEDLMNKVNDHFDGDDDSKINFNLRVLRNVAIAIDYAMKADESYQSDVLQILVNFTNSKITKEYDAVNCFQLAMKFMLTSTSKVSGQASLAIEKICNAICVRPVLLLNWYRRQNIKFIMEQVAENYIRRNVKMSITIKELAKLLRFSGSREFTIKYHKLIIAVLVPMLIKTRKLENILVEISEMCNKDHVQLLMLSYLGAFVFAYVHHSPDIADKVTDYLRALDPVSNSLPKIENNLNIAEVLIYYHKSPECVIKIFTDIRNSKSKSKEESLTEMSEYLAKQFLGILNIFQNNITTETEKFVRRHTLLSLGEIIRFMGTEKITQFRFKIFTLLNNALAINEPFLRDACINVWKIFVRTVDMMQIGSLLSSMFVTMKPLIDEFSDDVDEVLTYLVLENGNLLSAHFKEIFFLDELPIREELRKNIVMHQKKAECKNFLEKLEEYLHYIRHENVIVRGYGLKYLVKILRQHRTELNNLIIGESVINPIIGGILRNLMICCKEQDPNLQKLAAECIGELGAFEPSHLAPDYTPHSDFAFSIHSNEFAKMALQELCHAYQVQTDTRGVDCFALAIQEILTSHNVDLENQKNLHIWEAIPIKLQPLMKPLLSSCYTNLKPIKHISVHPIFCNTEIRTCEEWAHMWATKILEKISNQVTRNSLDKFLPSIKRDMNILSLIFPYIILHVIQANPNVAQLKDVQEELEAVLIAMVKINENSVNNSNSMEMEIDDFENEIGNIPASMITSCGKSILLKDTSKVKVKCAKLVFNIFDFLERYLREFINKYNQSDQNKDYKCVRDFLDSFDAKTIALANYQCEEYARALWYIEKYIKYDASNRLENELPFLAKIHAELFDFDSVEGVMALKSGEPSLEDKILLYNVTGRLHDSAACFEHILQMGDITPKLIKDMVECYIALDQPETALLISNNFYEKFGGEHNLTLKSTRAESLWRLGRWDDLEELINTPGMNKTESWGINCGQLMLNFRRGEHEKFNEHIEQIRFSMLRVLKTHESEESLYQKCYAQILKLHMLIELQKAEELMYEIKKKPFDISINVELNGLLSDWASRNEILQPTFQIMEPLLYLRRTILNELKIMLQQVYKERPSIVKTITTYLEESIGKLWIQSTELASKAGMYQQAGLYLFNADNYKLPDLFIHKAKLSWEKGDQANAFKLLNRGVNDMMKCVGGDAGKFNKDDKKICGEAQLLTALYNAQSMNVKADFNTKCFRDALIIYTETEKGFVSFAEYIDRIYNAMSEKDQKSQKGCEYLYQIVSYYGKSLLYGCHFVHQSTNRLLTLWLDYTSRKDSPTEYVEKMNRLVQRYSESLPKFVFFTTFSQLVSRICHPNLEVYTILKKILVTLIMAYPQQSLWMILAVYKSSYENRIKRCQEILRHRDLSSMQPLIWKFNMFTEKLIDLTNADPTDSSNRGLSVTIKTSVGKLAPQLNQFFNANQDIHILLPLEKHLQLVMPASRDRDKPAGAHNPFPNNQVYIQGIKEEVVVLASLQKPKKITLLATDGHEYCFLMKPKDDLRKDFRLMEFNNVVKQHLYEDTAARQRRLHIRTYAVLPLNDECGIIEWVQNVMPYRNILMGIYKIIGKGMSLKELRHSYPRLNDSIERKRQLFEQVFVARHPPVFDRWFKERFPNPHDWYQARCSYIKTLAVMSIAGYILGLGDRHGENILFDGSTGDVVHVDFNCLFNRGESFEWPELVPFRLTHNMVKAMGPLGVEGLYRKSCEITMRVMRAQKSTLMSVLRPFVYDPLVSWTKTISKAQSSNLERTDPQAMENIKKIENRLEGYIIVGKKISELKLSVEGHVNHVITEATNVDNLSSMYVGWGAYL